MIFPVPTVSLAPGIAGLAVALLVGLSQPILADTAGQPWYVGVNLAGAEFKSSKLPGRANKDYVYPTPEDIDYFLDQGFDTIRLPFRWERLQPELGGEFEPAELSRIDDVVAHVTRNDGHVILDPHNYARYFGKTIGSKGVPTSAFAAFWGRLADRYKDNPGVIFGLMNEPDRIRADLWRVAVDAAIAKIRTTGARNLILVPGTSWTGAHSWLKRRKGISNDEAFRTLTDPAGNMAFEVHQYFDSDFSGTSDECQHEAIGEESLKGFTRWLRENKKRGFLGEFGAANNEVCLEALDRMLRYVKANSDVWIGWTYWAAGAWWGDYRFSVHPSPGEEMKPQLKILKKYINGS